VAKKIPTLLRVMAQSGLKGGSSKELSRHARNLQTVLKISQFMNLFSTAVD
jgi:hypothetical protein